MHESSICRGLLERVLEVCARERADSVESITVQLGVVSGFDAGQVSAAFGRIAAGTLAEDARVDIEIVPLQVHCPACAGDSEVVPERLECPRCGHNDTRLIDGTEVRLSRIGLGYAGAAH